MFFYIALALLGFVLYQAINSYLSLQRNIAIAKDSGLPYLVLRKCYVSMIRLRVLSILAFTNLGVAWAQVCTNIIYPILNKLPYFKDALWVP